MGKSSATPRPCMEGRTDVEGIAFTPGALERLLGLARRAHDGQVYVTEIHQGNGLRWIEVDVLLTDMGDVPPWQTFRLSPTGVLKPSPPQNHSPERRADG